MGGSRLAAAEEAASGEIAKESSKDLAVIKASSRAPPEGGKKRGSLNMDSTVVGKILDMMGASNEQIAFLSVWATHVHDPAIAIAIEQQLFVSTDMRFLEVRV